MIKKIEQKSLFDRISFFYHPIPLSSVVLMFLNDHYLKYIYHNHLTGKLSDFLGLFYFPLFLSAIYCWLFAKDFNWNVLGLFALLTHIFFYLLKTDVTFNHWTTSLFYKLGLPSQFILDSSDLMAHASILLTIIWARFWFKNNLKNL